MSAVSRVATVSFAVAICSIFSAAKQQTWVEVRSPNFIVVSDAGEKSARKAAVQFEQIRAVFRQSIAIASAYPTPVVTILAVKDESSMRDLLPEYWVKGHVHPAGLFINRMNLYYAAVQLDAHGENPYETFYHEYYHAITLPYCPDLPVWLAEGLAEFFGHTEIGDKVVGLGHIDPYLLEELRQQTWIPLDVLFKVDRFSPYYNEANATSIFYAESWALTHYLMTKAQPSLAAYLRGFDRGQRPDETQAFGDLKALQGRLQAYVRSSEFMYLKGMAPPRFEESTLRIRELSEAESDAYRGGFAAIRDDTADASKLLEAAIRLNPSIAMAYQYLGMTEFLEGRKDEALESASKAITLDPDNGFTHYMRAFLTTSSEKGMTDEETEKDLRRAIALNPDFAPPFALLAQYLASTNQNLSEAFNFARAAISRDPGSSNYQLALAQVLARMRKYDEAERAVARAGQLAKNTSEKANVDSFTSYLNQVREYDRMVAARNAEDETTARIEPAEVSPVPKTGGGVRVEPAGSVDMQIQTSLRVLSSTSGVDLNPYLKQLMESLRTSLTSSISRVPISKQRSTAVDFSIARDGTLSDVKVTLSSGDPEFDKAARQGVAESAHVPTPPPQLKAVLRIHLGLTCTAQTPTSP